MATTGELRAIIEALELIDIGDAASYLGEEGDGDNELWSSAHPELLPIEAMLHLTVDISCRVPQS